MKSSIINNSIKAVAFCFLAFFQLNAFAQKKFTSDKGELSFTSNAKLELINATSKRVLGIIDPSTGQFAFIVKVQSFEGFNSNLQQQHFNDKYMDAINITMLPSPGKLLTR